MKRKIISLGLLIGFLVLGFSSITAQDVQLRFTGSFSSKASHVYPTTDVLYAVDATSMSSSTSNVVFPAPNNYRVQLKVIVLELKSTSASAIKVYGMSSGSTSTRTIYQVSVADSYAGNYTLLDDVTSATTKITSTISGQSTSTCTSTVTGLHIAKGKFVKISFCTGSSGGSTQNVNISGFDITPASTNPEVVLTSGITPVDAMELIELSPVVYTYRNVQNENNVIADWYTDNTYSTTSVAPANLLLTNDIATKTVTLSGTPAANTAGTYYYKIAVNETNGNAIFDSVIVSGYTTPAPVFSSPANKNQTVKANAVISDIVFSVENVTNVTAIGLPQEFTEVFAATDAQSGTFTISGSPAVQNSYPFEINYTLTATPLIGYTGESITTTGKITVKDPDAKSVLYIASDAVTTANDMFLAQLHTKYDVTKRPAQASFTGNYNEFDLIVLHESLTGGDAATTGHELRLMKDVDKPILNTKSYFYTAGSTPRWGWGTPNNGNSAKGIDVTQPSHPIFDGISLTDSLYIYNTLTAKNIQPTTVTIGGYQLAKVSGGVAIHDLPAAIRLGEGKTSKYLMVSLFNGKYNDLTADALKLLDNAVNYLLSGTQFAAPNLEISSFTVNDIVADIDHAAGTISAQLPAETNLTALTPIIALSGTGTTVNPSSGTATNFTTSKNYTVSDGINTKVYAVTITTPTGVLQLMSEGIIFDGKTIHNPNRIDLQIIDLMGRAIIRSNYNIEVSKMLNGIYILKTNNSMLKIMITK